MKTNVDVDDLFDTIATLASVLIRCWGCPANLARWNMHHVQKNTFSSPKRKELRNCDRDQHNRKQSDEKDEEALIIRAGGSLVGTRLRHLRKKTTVADRRQFY